MISRLYLSRLALSKSAPRTFLFPSLLAGLPMVTNGFSIAVPKVPLFKFSSKMRSEYNSILNDLINAQKSEDIGGFCAKLDQALAVCPVEAVAADILKLMSPEWVSKLNSSRISHIMGKMSAVHIKTNSEMLQMCSVLCKNISVNSCPPGDLLMFLEGLTHCGYNADLAQDNETLNSILGCFAGTITKANFSQLAQLMTGLNGFGLSWTSLHSHQRTVETVLRNELKTATAMDSSALLLALGQMGFELTDDSMGALVASMATKSLTSVLSVDASKLDASLSHPVASILRGLGAMQQRFSNCSSTLQQLILQSVSVCLPMMSTADCATSLHSLGKLELRWTDLNVATRNAILTALSQLFNASLTSGSTVDTLLGITMMGVTKRNLSVDLQDELQYCLAKVMKTMSSQQISITANCFGKLEVEWNYLNRVCQEAILSGMILEFKQKVPQSVAVNIRSLSMLGVKFQQFSRTLQSVIEESLPSCLPNMNGVSFSNTIYHLGKMRLSWQQCSTHLNVTILNSLVTQMHHLDQVPRLLFGLGTIGLKWRELPAATKSIVLSAIEKSLESYRLAAESFPEMQVSWVLHALADMKVEWSALTPSAQATIYSALEMCSNLQNSSLCNVLTSLAQIGVKWSAVPAASTDTLLNCIRSLAAFSDNVEYHVSSSIWALGAMNCEWSALPREILETSLVRAAGSGVLSTTTVSRVLWSLGQMGSSWSALSDDLKLKLKDSVVSGEGSFSMRELTSTMHALSVLSFDSPSHTNRDLVLWSTHYSLVKAFKRLLSEDRISYSEQSQAQIYLELLRSVPLGVEMLNRVLPDVSKVLSRPNKQHQALLSEKMSNMHVDVARNTKQQLREHSDKFRLVNEFSGFESGELPVDIAVYCGAKLVALVELDGEHHYSPSGVLSRSDEMKEYLYSIKFPGVPLFRIKNSMIQDRGFQKTGSALTLAILMVLDDAKAK